MNVTVHHLAGSVDIQNFDQETVLALLAEWEHGTGRYMQIELNAGETQVYVAREHITRIDVDYQERR